MLPGAGAFEIACSEHLNEYARKQVSGKVKIGVHCFAEALLVVPRTLAQNSGFDAQDTLLKVQEAHIKDKKPFGVDVYTGEPLPATVSAVWQPWRQRRWWG